MHEHITIPFIGVVGVIVVVEEGTGVAVDGSGIGCVTAKKDRQWDFFYITLNIFSTIYMLHTMYMLNIMYMLHIMYKLHIMYMLHVMDMLHTMYMFLGNI